MSVIRGVLVHVPVQILTVLLLLKAISDTSTIIISFRSYADFRQACHTNAGPDTSFDGLLYVLLLCMLFIYVTVHQYIVCDARRTNEVVAV